MTKEEAVIAYLKETFPPGEVGPPRDYSSAVVPVFPVTENYVERQLEIERGLFDDLHPQKLVQLLRSTHAAETMRDQPGRRVVARRIRGDEVALDIETLRT
ncbi:MAG: hypothetical protein ACREJV_14955 [Candidatus Rokuibacteriota bacterium]